MSAHALTVAGYLAIASVAVLLEVLSHWPGSRVPSFGTLCARVMRTRSGRVALMVGWLWLGLHYFAA